MKPDPWDTVRIVELGIREAARRWATTILRETSSAVESVSREVLDAPDRFIGRQHDTPLDAALDRAQRPRDYEFLSGGLDETVINRITGHKR
jgi:hypothetical protein